jgi:hypothetical protein
MNEDFERRAIHYLKQKVNLGSKVVRTNPIESARKWNEL